MSKLAAYFGRDRQIYIVAFVISILLSSLIDYRNSVINPDGICYLLSAQIVGSSSIKDVMHLCPQSQWPFYSTLIYAIGQVTHLSFTTSAHVLNGIFSLISILTFIMIIKELNGNNRVLWLGAIVILFDHQFNVLRDNIIRDHGFWAFYLLSIYFFLSYFRDPRWIKAIAWTMSLVTATLFRIEGAIFLIVLPFICWLDFSQSFKVRAKSFFILNLPLIFIMLVLGIWQLSNPQSMGKLGRLSEIINQLQHGLHMVAHSYQSTKNAIMNHVLPDVASADVTAVVFLLWTSWYVYNIVLTLSFVYAALIIYAWKKRVTSFSSRTSLILWGYIVINFILTLGFLAEHLFISKRYLVALTLVLIIWVPFAIDDLMNKWATHRYRAFSIIMGLIFFVTALSGVVEFGHSKFYIRSAGNWIAENVPADAKLYANDFQLMYYSQHYNLQIFKLLPKYLQIKTITNGKWKKYDYLALRLRTKEEGEMANVLNEMSGITPIHEFSNKRGNRVAVYKISREEN